MIHKFTVQQCLQNIFRYFLCDVYLAERIYEVCLRITKYFRHKNIFKGSRNVILILHSKHEMKNKWASHVRIYDSTTKIQSLRMNCMHHLHKST